MAWKITMRHNVTRESKEVLILDVGYQESLNKAQRENQGYSVVSSIWEKEKVIRFQTFEMKRRFH